MFKDKTRDFEDQPGTQTLNGFCQEALNVASGVLNAMKSAFDAFTNAVEQPVKFGRVLQGLVSTFGGPDTIAGASLDVGLPLVTEKAFVAKDVAVPDPLQDHFSGLSLVRIGGDQVI